MKWDSKLYNNVSSTEKNKEILSTLKKGDRNSNLKQVFNFK